jgi:anti-anti-sigma factor
MPLTISIQKSATPTVTLGGRLDTDTAPELDAALRELLERRDITRLIFEVSQLDYLSSAGIRCFIRARKAIEPNGGKVAIVNPQPGVRKVLEIVKALPPGGIFASVAELDAYLDDIQRQIRKDGD